MDPCADDFYTINNVSNVNECITPGGGGWGTAGIAGGNGVVGYSAGHARTHCMHTITVG